MYLVKQAVNKGVRIREPQARICGSAVRRIRSSSEGNVLHRNGGELIHVPVRLRV